MADDSSRGRPGVAAFDDFVSHELGALLSRHTQLDLSAHVLGWFRDAVRDVPAYARFLEERGVDPASIQTLTDFAGLPVTSKAEYHKAFPLPDLCRGGALERADFVAVSSGSTGEPTFWPRFFGDELGTSARFEQVLRAGFGLESKRTLGVVCFALGSWVGGMYTTFAGRNLSAKGYPLTLVTPGNNRAEILRVVRRARAELRRTGVVRLSAVPEGRDRRRPATDGVIGRGLRVHLVTAGEVFSEEWRSLVVERLGATRGPARHRLALRDGRRRRVLANETPLSPSTDPPLPRRSAGLRRAGSSVRIALADAVCSTTPIAATSRRMVKARVQRRRDRSSDSLPHPRPRQRRPVLADDGVPAQLTASIPASHGAGVAAALPFVSVFGRSGFALSFYGANVYPENVSVGLEQPEITGAGRPASS